MTIKLNPAFKKAYSCKNRYRIIYGGAGSGKSFYVGQETIINMLSSSDYQYLVVRKTGKSIRQSVFRLLVDIIHKNNLSKAFRINKTEMSIVSITGSSLITSGLDDVEKLKSVAGINRIWIEEASEITEKDFDQLDLRLRGQSRIGFQMTLTFNPISELHWIKKKFFDVGIDNTFILKTTYLDNPFLDDQYVKTLNNLKITNKQFYRVYALGEWGSIGNVIYSNWEKQDLSEAKKSFDNLYYGVDFGFADDPTTCICVHYDKKRKIIYIFDEFYQKEVFIDDLAKILKDKIHGRMVTCDSSEPRSIADLRRNGINAVGAKKGPDSIEHGINWIKSHKIIVDNSCTNTIMELSTYQYKEDKNGDIIPKPIDANNHLLDALRYALEDEMNVNKINTINKSLLGL